MKVFLSYAHDDRALAHILAYAIEQAEPLRNLGIKVFVDRQLGPGAHFRDEIKQQIRAADIVLVLLTTASVASSWVNQEIGFAIAREKRLLPLEVETELGHAGMLADLQCFVFYEWANPPSAIARLVGSLESEARRLRGEGYSGKAGLDRILRGRRERTDYIVKRLRDLRTKLKRDLTVYCRAAFSIFAVSDSDEYRQASPEPEEVLSLLVQEREEFAALLETRHVRLRMMLWPARAYSHRFSTLRFENLLAWMRSALGDDMIEFACVRHLDSNLLIVPDEFCIEGQKTDEPIGIYAPGYDKTIVTEDTLKIQRYVDDFQRVLPETDNVADQKRQAIARIEAMCEEDRRRFLDEPPVS